MSMNLIHMVWYFSAGAGIGLLYFAGLWWTLKRMSSFSHPAAWIAGSFLVRSAISISGIYLVSAGNWAGMLVCLFGFFMMRMIWVSKSKRKILST